MAPHRKELTRRLPYLPEQLFELVGDVARYPEFVPWVSAMRTWNSVRPAVGVTQVDAEAEVGFAMIKEKFATRVRRDLNRRQIDVNLLYGPFRKLHNRWRFEPDGEGATIQFLIEFEFKSRILDALLAANATRAAEKIMNCFEARAAALYEPARVPGAPG